MTKPKSVFLGLFLGVLLVLSGAAILPILPKAEATTTVISSNTAFMGTVNAGDTLIIQSGVIVTSDGITNNGNIVNSGGIRLNEGKALNNYGILLNHGGGRVESGIVNNYASGIMKNDLGDNDIAPSDGIVNNYGTFTSYNGIRGTYTTINNFKTGIIESHNPTYLYNSNLNNYGGLINSYGPITLDCCTILNNGTINVYGGIGVMNSQSADVIQNAVGGVFNNIAGSLITIPSRPGGYTKELANSGGTLNNDGTISSSGLLANSGIFNNKGSIENKLGPNGVNGNLNNSGTLNNKANANITNYSIINNFASGTVNNQGTITDKCNAQFNNSGTYNGNPVVNDCITFPITHMSDTTATAGYGVHAPKPARAEFASATSQLIGDKIDSITLKLKRVGTISGTAEIGILDSTNNVKKSFGTINVSALTTAYADYEFHLSNNELYTIQSGERIGIKYTGGDTNNWVAVMLDLDPADPFDGTNSYHQYYQGGGWLSSTDRDMYMVLKQTHA